MNDDWRSQAACRRMDVSLFFTEVGRNLNAARRVCNACPVELACLQFAVRERIPHGVFGGKSPKERRAIRRQLRIEAT